MMNFNNIILKIFFALFILYTVSTFAQETGDPNVELPDFVITGTDVIDVQKAKKIKPEIISTVSQGFFKPAFSPEELEVKDLSNPVKDEIALFDSVSHLSGSLDAGVGTYSMPEASAAYGIPFNTGIFAARAFMDNQKEHVKYSDIFSAGGGIDLTFFVNSESSFLPGSQFNINGDYQVSSYNFYGSATKPSEERIHYNGSIGLKVDDLLSDIIIFGADFKNNFSSLDDEDFSENLIDLTGYSKLELDNFNLTANLDYKNQFVDDSLNQRQHSYFGIRPAAGLVFSKVLKAFFGFNYQRALGNNFFAPYASVAFRINDNFSLYGQFTPHAEFITAGEFLRKNPYYNVQDRRNIFVENQHNLRAGIKFEYDKYYEIDGGVEFRSSDNMPYFTDAQQSGRFDVLSADANRYSAFVNFLFHPGPYGMFYGNIELSRTVDSASNFLPYHPIIESNFIYSYDFDFGLNVQANLEFNSVSYANLSNKKKIDPYADLGLKFGYRIAQNFSLTFALSNLFSRDNYRWYNYRETPLELIAGINFKW